MTCVRWSVLAAVGLLGCSAASPPPPPAWDYGEESGPAAWGSLGAQYRTCDTGTAQSPIDLRDGTPAETGPLVFHYRAEPVHLINNGHTIEQEDDEGGCRVRAAGGSWRLVQFHFHSPSEHTVEGRQFPMEMHLVHKDEAGQVLVVGVLIQAGAHNAAFDSLWAHLPSEGQSHRGGTVDPGRLLPAPRAYWHYEGSFTTPPCTEGVRWYVLRTPISLGAEQIEAFRARISGNNRPVQPLEGRTIWRGN